jgi:guanylate kinase
MPSDLDGAGPGKLVVISGPSGAGKTSICRALIEQLSNAVLSVSATTRPIRPGEREGDSYFFLTPEEFARQEVAGEFLETAPYIGHRYGTPRKPVEQALKAGRTVILEIEVQGGMQVAARMPQAVLIFVLPPNIESLRARLAGRNTEAEDQLARRLAQADGEIATARDSGAYKYFVVNDILDATVDRVKRILQQECIKHD